MPENTVPVVTEVAPNSSISTAQNINLGFDAGETTTVNINGQFVGGEDGTEGTIGGTVDLDTYSFDLNVGDVVDLGAFGAADNLVITSPSGFLVLDSLSNNVDITGPRPGPEGLVNARATASFVATESGSYTVGVPGIEEGEYSITANVTRSALDSQAGGNVQYFFLDFDGAENFDTTRFGGTETGANLTGISGFLENWGLAPGDENAVIDSIASEFGRIFSETGGNVVVLNSRDHDPNDFDNVSTIVIGGSVGEAGLATIGAGQIDVGNLNSEDEAVVLLDTLSAGEDSPLFALSANNIQLGDGFTRADAIGRVVGAYAAREGGHLLGLYDTEGIDSPGSEPNVVVTDEGFFSSQTFTGIDNVLDGNDFQIGFGPDSLEGNRLLGLSLPSATIAAVTQANGSGIANRPDTNTTIVTGAEEGSEVTVSQSSISMSSSSADGNAVVNETANKEDSNITIDGLNGPATVSFDGNVTNNTTFVGGDLGSNATLAQGSDVLVGGNGGDTLNGHLGDDLIIGNGGDDIIVGSFGNDIIDGGEGNDQIDAGRDNDTVFGGAGDDRIYGRDGDDFIDGGAGNDKLAGGAGSDTFVFTNGSGQDRIFDFEAGVDRIEIDSTLLGENGAQLSTEELINQYATLSESGDTIEFDFGNGDTLTVNNPFHDLAAFADEIEIV